MTWQWIGPMTGKGGGDYDWAVTIKATFKQAYSKRKERKQWQRKL
jgi:hypothetical protein